MAYRLVVLSGLFLSFILAPGAVTGQSGCTDPQALNYDSTAVENDGSCEYPETDYTPICLDKFPDSISECSGLQYFDGQLYALNDGGNGPRFFQIDTANGRILRTITVRNFPNNDWEDMAQDVGHLYIGDFGNNLGSRTDLKILKIKKSDLARDTVNAEEIKFQFADQTDFTPRNRAHNFDCEAFFFRDGRLYLFSKNWEDKRTRLYEVSTVPGDYSLEPIAEFEVGGLVTAADISPDGEKILLLCYTENGRTFLWLLFDYQDFMPFSGNKRRIKTGSALNRGQVEGLAFQNNVEGFIGSEDISVVEGKLLHFKIGQWLDNTGVSTSEIASRSILHFYPNPFIDELLVDVKYGGRKIKKIEIYDQTGRRVLKKKKGMKKRIRIDGSKLSPGMYVMKVFLKKGGVIVEKIVKKN